MRNVIALIYSLLTLAGCMDGPGTTLVSRSAEDGVETVLSKTRIAAGTVRFQCVRSASGRCHYAVFAGQCTQSVSANGGAAAQCSTRSIGSFDVAVGEERERSDLPGDFRLCVSHRAGAVDAECRPRG